MDTTVRSPMCFLLNPAADRSRSGRVTYQVERFIRERDDGSELIMAGSLEALRRHARAAAGRFRVVVACGGDGTVREVVSAVTGHTVVLGILPVGSGNDLSKSLAIPTDPRRALDLLVTGTVRYIDVGEADGQIFLNTMGIGFDGLTNIYAQELTSLRGRHRYTLAALRAMAVYRPALMEIQADGYHVEQSMFMITIANGRVEGGNFWVAPRARIDDGRLDLVMIERLPRWRIPSYLIKLMKPDYEQPPPLTRKQVTQVHIRSARPVAAHADGEIFSRNLTEVTVRVRPAALPVICGQF